MNQETQPRQIWQLPTEHVNALAAAGTMRSVPRGTVVIHEGEDGDTMYIIVEGRVRIFLADEDGREVFLNECGPGEHFGEMMLDYGLRAATVVTAEACRFSVLTRAQLETYMIEHPELALAMLRMLIGRVRVLTRTVGNLSLLDVYGRVAHLLLDMAVEENGRLVIERRLTQQDIATRVGASREMVSRILKDLRAGGYVETEDNRMVVLRSPPKTW